MGDVVIPYRPRSQQMELHQCDARWMVTLCHRRFGKTVYAINKLIRANFTCGKESPRYAYIAPYLKQAKTIAWDYLKHFSRPIPGIVINESELRIDYPNGGRIRLFGADNPDALRGVYLDGAVLDEYAQVRPGLFGEIIRPALSDRAGWCEFLGTPKGKNHFYDLVESARGNPDWNVSVYRASETGIVNEVELLSARSMMTDDEYLQEYECSFTASIQGAYYAKELAEARDGGRICAVPVEKLPVHTFWDLGMNDTTAIWFMQVVGREHRFIDYYEANGEGLEHYARVLRERDYLFGTHYLPHDVEVTELGTGKSRKEILTALGVKPIKTVKRVSSVGDGIELTRRALSRCWFDADRCKDGLRALENYQKAWDDRNQCFRDHPLHNWASNGADAFRQYAQGFSEEFGKWKPLPKSGVAGIV